jgi:tRNA uridine 5-carboxymethylaminomethyl modification enzyme
MIPSFVEYRLSLRCDNADIRLTETGRAQGLIDDTRWKAFTDYRERLFSEKKRLSEYFINPTKENLKILLELGGVSGKKISAFDLLKRKEITYHDLGRFGYRGSDNISTPGDENLIYNLVTDIRYEGYLQRQESEISRQKRLEEMKIPPDFDFENCELISFRARKSLLERKPANLGQASRLEGVSPADTGVLANLIQGTRGYKFC